MTGNSQSRLAFDGLDAGGGHGARELESDGRRGERGQQVQRGGEGLVLRAAPVVH